MSHNPPDPKAPDVDASQWWRSAVVYQIYVRSFADGNGDGTGDIAGMRSRLPYLARLGVDAVWVNPWYRSPLNDGGYDVADYREINEQFGTTTEAEQFIEEARSHGIRVIVDLVPNHTSSEHRWFVDALAAGAGSPERARYHFLPGRGTDGELPPNDWPSVFGGSAWSRVADGEWYLHIFDESQPDVNWEHPDVISEFEDVMRFWLDRGAAGFRIDVAHSLVKEPGYPDLGTRSGRDGPQWTEGHPFWDRDDVHPIIRRWRRLLDDYDDDRMMVAEAWVRTDRRSRYLRPDEYHQAFDFDLLSASWSASDFRAIVEGAITASAAVGSNPTWVLSNHDVMRHATRYGLPAGTDLTRWPLEGPHELLDQAAGTRRARAAALITLGLPGSAYVYQGDELGLPDAWDLPLDVLADPIWEDSGHRVKGRDGCRVPIPWESTGPSLGFGSAEPWLPQPNRYSPLAAAEQQDDPTSTLNLYRRALAVRTELLVGDQSIEFLDMPPNVFGFRRGSGVRCIANMGSESVAMPPGEVLVTSGDAPSTELAPDTAVWLA